MLDLIYPLVKIAMKIMVMLVMLVKIIKSHGILVMKMFYIVMLDVIIFSELLIESMRIKRDPKMIGAT